MTIKGVGLTTFSVSNLANAKKFFVDTLGLTLINEDSSFGWLEIGLDKCCPILGVGQEDPQYSSHKAGMNGIMSFLVDNIEEEKARLEKKGVSFEGAIQEVPGHVKLALFSDPSGNKFYLVEDLSETK